MELAIEGELDRPEWSHVDTSLGKARIEGFHSFRLPNGPDAIDRRGVWYRGRGRLGHHSRLDHVGCIVGIVSDVEWVE